MNTDQVEAIYKAIYLVRSQGKNIKELRMQSATLWKLRPDLHDILFIPIIEDETIKKGVVQIISE